MNLKKTYFEIIDPCGKIRTIPFSTLENKTFFSIPLKEPNIESDELVFSLKTHTENEPKLWFELKNNQTHAEMGDFATRAAELPLDVPLELGNTTITLLSEETQVDLPKTPAKIQPFYTQSESGKNLLWTTKKAAQTNLSVYIQGETGTGKEIIAQHIHGWSSRSGAPFVPLNCGALAESIAESELFGHAKGAFTGAIKQRAGAFLQAHGGTLFLDEIADLSTDLQVKLLRFLENGEVRPVGSDHHFHVDVRVICASHKNLETLVKEGRFRQDLYYRLASLTLNMPALRNRPEDIELLSKKQCKKFEKQISTKAMIKLKTYHWPGNVRELMHTLSRACGLAGPFQTILQESDFDFLQLCLEDHLKEKCERSNLLTLKEMERYMLIKALRLTDGNRAKTADVLGVARSTLFVMLKRHKIKKPKKIWEDAFQEAI